MWPFKKKKVISSHMIVWVVVMARGGNLFDHSYVLGAWSTEALAMRAGGIEEVWRGKKYRPYIQSWEVDNNEFDVMFPYEANGSEEIAPLELRQGHQPDLVAMMEDK